MKIKLEKVENSRANKVYILLNYSGGDADSDHPEEYILKDVTFDTIEDNIAIIEKEVNDYKILKKILYDTDIKYKNVLEDYGEEMAELFETVPNDPQCDYQFKCSLSTMQLIAYDGEGNKYKQSLYL